MYKLDHLNVIKLHSHFEDDFKIYLLLEYASGGTLKNKLDQKDRLSELESAQYFSQLTNAIKHLHSIDVFHRDIKPENILFDAEGRVKLADFGIATYDSDDTENLDFVGTEIYCAPEMI